jgi:addiction module RelE/StbE family toxin
MKLRFTPRATRDLSEIAEFIRAQSPAGAQRVRAAIVESLANLASFPKIGRRQTTEGVRKLVTRKYAYLVYYTIDESSDEVVVLTIRHPARARAFEDG